MSVIQCNIFKFDNIEIIHRENGSNKLRQQWDGICMAMVISLYLCASFEDLDNHREKLVTCNMEMNIGRNQQIKELIIEN